MQGLVAFQTPHSTRQQILRAGLYVLTMLLAAPCHAGSFLDSLKTAIGGQYIVRGRVQVQDGQWLTCFNGISSGYLGPANLMRPGDAQTNPATGNIQVSTAAIPTIIMTRDGVVTSSDCDSLAQQGLLLADGAAAPGASAQTPGKIRDKYGCGEWTEEEFRVADKGEIMACQASVITDREFARQQAERQAGAADGAAPAATTTGAGVVTQQAAVSQLQQDTAAKFKAIQAQSAAPAAAPAQSDEDLAWDGAKLCGLKPAFMMKLKEDAVQFVRIDNAADRIVLSEVAGGARQEVAVDGKGFAQRSMFNATAIGQGGDTCGRAFWNAEAYKAASAAMSQ